MIRKIKKLISLRTDLREGTDTRYQVSFVTEEYLLRVAQRLHAKVYLERKFIEEHHLTEDGRISIDSDPYQEHADYFIVNHIADGNSEVVATARQITVHSQKGHMSFPTIEKLPLYPKDLAAIKSLDPLNCVEISGLAKHRGHSSYAALLLYRAMWQHSVRSGHQLWLMACDAQVYSQLKFMFGDALTQIGEPTVYMGSEVIPAALEVHQSLGAIMKAARGINPLRRTMKLELVKFFVRGLNPDLLTPQHVAELKRLSIFKGELPA